MKVTLREIEKATTWRCILLGHTWEWFSDMAGTSKQCRRCKRYGWPE